MVRAGVATLAADTRFLPRGAIVAVLMYPLVLEGVGLEVIVVAVLLGGVSVTLGSGLFQHVLEGYVFRVVLVRAVSAVIILLILSTVMHIF